jgi:hypothetical protein
MIAVSADQIARSGDRNAIPTARETRDELIQSNIAMTDFGPSTTRLQVVALPLVLQSPPQPANVLPLVGFAVSTTVLPSAKLAVGQFTALGPVPPQNTPGGLLFTVPLPATDWHWRMVHDEVCVPKLTVTCT